MSAGPQSPPSVPTATNMAYAVAPCADLPPPPASVDGRLMATPQPANPCSAATTATNASARDAGDGGETSRRGPTAKRPAAQRSAGHTRKALRPQPRAERAALLAPQPLRTEVAAAKKKGTADRRAA